MDDVASAAEVVLGMRMNALEAARMARRVVEEARGALSTAACLADGAVRSGQADRAPGARDAERARRDGGAAGQRRRAASRASSASSAPLTDRWIADLAACVATAGALPAAVELRVSHLRDLAVAVAALRVEADRGVTSPHRSSMRTTT